MTKRKLAIAITLTAGLIGGSTMALAAAVFDGFVDSMRVICTQQPSDSCAYAVRTFLDADGDGYITESEILQAREEAQGSMTDQGAGLGPEERSIIAVALLVTNDAQISDVFSNFDSNGDGGLEESELFADFTMDQRPFAELVSDPDAVDWKAFATRFGPAGILILGLLPPEYH